MLLAVLDGVYPRQRDIHGKFAWMREGGGFYQSPNGLSANEPQAIEIEQVGKAVVSTRVPVDSEIELGGAYSFPNDFNPLGNTSYSIQWAKLVGILPQSASTFDSWTFACVAGPANFPSFAGINRTIFKLFDAVNTPIFFDVGGSPEVARLWTDQFADNLQVSTNAPVQSTVVWVFLQRADGTKEIWQDGLLLGTQVHLMSPVIFDAGIFLATYINNAGKLSWSGPIGASIFSTRAWTEDQVSEYTADPYGHHRPFPQQVSFPICLDASLGVSPVLDADLGTSIVLDASLGSAPVLDADLGASPVLDADLGSSLVLDADLRVCDKEG